MTGRGRDNLSGLFSVSVSGRAEYNLSRERISVPRLLLFYYVIKLIFCFPLSGKSPLVTSRANDRPQVGLTGVF